MTVTRSMLALLAAALTSSVWAGERCSAINGETLRCRGERVRIEGVHAPKLSAPGGQQARQRLQRLIRSGEVVIERKGLDKHGRTLARVYVNGNRITQLDLRAAPGRKAGNSRL